MWINGYTAASRTAHLSNGGVCVNRRQQGQALSEVIIAAIILVPMFLLVPIIAKYIHGHQIAQQAARAAAWEATVTEDYNIEDNLDTPAEREKQRQQLIDRHFSRADVAVRTRAPGALTAPEEDQFDNPLFNTYSNQPLATREDAQLSSYCYAGHTSQVYCEGDHETPGVVAWVFDRLDTFGTLPLIGNLIPKPVSDNGLVTSRFELSFQNLRYSDGSPAAGHAPPRFAFLEPFDALDLKLETKHTLLVDPWNAAGSGMKGDTEARSVLNQLQPGGARPVLVPVIEALGFLTDIVDGVVGLLDWVPGIGPRLPKIRVYEASVDIVPEEHLQ